MHLPDKDAAGQEPASKVVTSLRALRHGSKMSPITGYGMAKLQVNVSCKAAF